MGEGQRADAEGEPVGPSTPVSLDAEVLKGHANHFNGELLQTPPAYSAKKIGGRTAYSLARAGEAVELAPVRIVVHEFAITSVDGDSAAFQATVSAGGYIRSLAHDLGQRLGCGAHLASLRRVAAGPFCADAALSLEELATLAEAGELERYLPVL